MGLAAVPFGTAQVHGDPVEYKVKVIKKETDECRRCAIVVSCSLEEGIALQGISLYKDEDAKPRVSFRGDGRCRFSSFNNVAVSSDAVWGGVHAYRVSSFIVKAGRGGEAQRFRVDTYCCLGGENTDFDRTVVSFCLPDSETLPSDISISVDSEVPVLFSGKFSSVKTNNPADEQRFSVYAQCFSVPFSFSYSLEEDKKSDRSEIKSGDEEEESEEEEPAKPMKASDRIKALFEADRARREKDPELEKERMRREKAVINARNRIREFIRIDLESRKIKEDKKIEKNEIIIKEPKKEEKLFEGFSKEDYFKGFDAFKENLSSEFKKNLKKNKSEKNEIKIEGKKSKESEIFKSEDCFEFHESRFEFYEVGNPNQIKIEDKKEEEDKKEDAKIDQSEIAFGNKSLAESVYNDKSIEESDEFRSRKEKCLVSDDSED